MIKYRKKVNGQDVVIEFDSVSELIDYEKGTSKPTVKSGSRADEQDKFFGGGDSSQGRSGLRAGEASFRT